MRRANNTFYQIKTPKLYQDFWLEKSIIIATNNPEGAKTREIDPNAILFLAQFVVLCKAEQSLVKFSQSNKTIGPYALWNNIFQFLFGLNFILFSIDARVSKRAYQLACFAASIARPSLLLASDEVVYGIRQQDYRLATHMIDLNPRYLLTPNQDGMTPFIALLRNYDFSMIEKMKPYLEKLKNNQIEIAKQLRTAFFENNGLNFEAQKNAILQAVKNVQQFKLLLSLCATDPQLASLMISAVEPKLPAICNDDYQLKYLLDNLELGDDLKSVIRNIVINGRNSSSITPDQIFEARQQHHLLGGIAGTSVSFISVADATYLDQKISLLEIWKEDLIQYSREGIRFANLVQRYEILWRNPHPHIIRLVYRPHPTAFYCLGSNLRNPLRQTQYIPVEKFTHHQDLLFFIDNYYYRRDALKTVPQDFNIENFSRTIFQQLIITLYYFYSVHNLSHALLDCDSLWLTHDLNLKILFQGVRYSDLLKRMDQYDLQQEINYNFDIESCRARKAENGNDLKCVLSEDVLFGKSLYAAGVYLYIILTGKTPFFADKDIEPDAIFQKNDLRDNNGFKRKKRFEFLENRLDHYPPAVKNLIHRLLQPPKRIISIQGILTNPWFAEYFNFAELDCFPEQTKRELKTLIQSAQPAHANPSDGAAPAAASSEDGVVSSEAGAASNVGFFPRVKSNENLQQGTSAKEQQLMPH